MTTSCPETKSSYHHRPLRIAVIGVRAIPNNYSGLERSCECLFPLLAERGHEVTVYCRAGALTEKRESYLGVRLVVTKALEGRSLETISHTTTSVAHAITRGGYDLVHFHALAPNLLAPVCRIANLPMVTTVHGLDWQRAKWQGIASRVLRCSEALMVGYVDEIICVSRDLQEYYLRTYNRATTYIPNGIALSKRETMHSKEALAMFGLGDKPYIVFVGRLVPEKRVHDLIKAFAKVDADYFLVIVGDGRHSQEYVDELIEIGDVPVVTGIEDKLAKTDNSEHATWLYKLVLDAQSFQLSWDQDLPSAEATKMLEQLAALFLGEQTPEGFVDTMTGQ